MVVEFKVLWTIYQKELSQFGVYRDQTLKLYYEGVDFIRALDERRGYKELRFVEK
jgi:hypothetical protein